MSVSYLVFERVPTGILILETGEEGDKWFRDVDVTIFERPVVLTRVSNISKMDAKHKDEKAIDPSPLELKSEEPVYTVRIEPSRLRITGR